MALGLVLPALGVGAMAMIVYALLADLDLARAFLIFLGSGLASLAGMAAVVAVRHPMRPVDTEGRPQAPMQIERARSASRSRRRKPNPS